MPPLGKIGGLVDLQAPGLGIGARPGGFIDYLVEKIAEQPKGVAAGERDDKIMEFGLSQGAALGVGGRGIALQAFAESGQVGCCPATRKQANADGLYQHAGLVHIGKLRVLVLQNQPYITGRHICRGCVYLRSAACAPANGYQRLGLQDAEALPQRPSRDIQLFDEPGLWRK